MSTIGVDNVSNIEILLKWSSSFIETRRILTGNYLSMALEESSVPKEAGVDATTIRSIAIDIMACFSTHWELLVRKEFKDRVPTMLSLLSVR